jgi:hypothetical protein
MSIEAGIVARLNAVAGVTNLVSDRIYADLLPDGTTHPAIVYQLISTTPIDSNISTDGGMFRSRVQLTLIVDTKSATIGLSEAIKAALIRFKGASSDVTFIDTRLEDISDQAYDLETGQTARIMDFIIYWE